VWKFPKNRNNPHNTGVPLPVSYAAIIQAPSVFAHISHVPESWISKTARPMKAFYWTLSKAFEFGLTMLKQCRPWPSPASPFISTFETELHENSQTHDHLIHNRFVCLQHHNMYHTRFCNQYNQNQNLDTSKITPLFHHQSRDQILGMNLHSCFDDKWLEVHMMETAWPIEI
jgi:hypothetical protein